MADNTAFPEISYDTVLRQLVSKLDTGHPNSKRYLVYDPSENLIIIAEVSSALNASIFYTALVPSQDELHQYPTWAIKDRILSRMLGTYIEKFVTMVRGGMEKVKQTAIWKNTIRPF